MPVEPADLWHRDPFSALQLSAVSTFLSPLSFWPSSLASFYDNLRRFLASSPCSPQSGDAWKVKTELIFLRFQFVSLTSVWKEFIAFRLTADRVIMFTLVYESQPAVCFPALCFPRFASSSDWLIVLSVFADWPDVISLVLAEQQ